MFRLWRPTPQTTKKILPVRRRQTALHLEALEARDCPSASPWDAAVGAKDAGPPDTAAVMTAGTGLSLSLSVVPGPGDTAAVSSSTHQIPDPPTIVNFQAIHNGGNNWTFTGQVQSPSAEGLVVTLAGIPSLDDTGASATVEADGTFSYTVTLRPGESGDVTAQCIDEWGQASNEATAYVTG